jgi:CheY-like chemotaxis protein
VKKELFQGRVRLQILKPGGNIASAGALFMRTEPRPDVVVLDLMMPVMSGWEVLEEVDADTSLRLMPIVVASAMAAPTASPGRRGGVRMSLPKPLDVDLLLSALVELAAPAS